jgi:hypothetical protein
MKKNLKKAIRLTQTPVPGSGEVNVDELWPVNGNKALAINEKRKANFTAASKELMEEGMSELMKKLADG